MTQNQFGQESKSEEVTICQGVLVSLNIRVHDSPKDVPDEDYNEFYKSISKVE